MSEVCDHEWRKEENKEWYEGYKASNRVAVTVKTCKKCEKEEILGGIIYCPPGGIYELLPPDGSIGGALCACGW